MTQPIDPQLGVPTTPNLDIPQIPYKKLPFPYQDLTDVPQPDNAQYYPDHIPGVVSTVAAMHPTGTQAQDIHSNGNHAMLVDDVSGGGTAGLWANMAPFGIQRFDINPGANDNQSYPHNRYFFGIFISASIFDFGHASPGSLAMGEVIFNLNNIVGLCVIPLGGYYDGTSLTGTYTGMQTIMFKDPIDMDILGYGFGGNPEILIDNTTVFDVVCNISPFMGNP